MKPKISHVSTGKGIIIVLESLSPEARYHFADTELGRKLCDKIYKKFK